MILYPAIDIKDGQCVRLKQGLADQVTVFDKDPVAAAAHWLGMGAKALHVVDLDGAGRAFLEALGTGKLGRWSLEVPPASREKEGSS